jgi:TRAP-type C4-dicarboxylate transport system permease small subunit
LHVSSLDTKPWSKPMYRKALTNLTMKLNTKTRGFVSLFYSIYILAFSYLLSSSSRDGVFFLCNNNTFVNMTDGLPKKMIYLAFLWYFIMIRMRKAATVGQYLIASFSKFVARISQMTNQRSESSSLYFIACEACWII